MEGPGAAAAAAAPRREGLGSRVLRLLSCQWFGSKRRRSRRRRPWRSAVQKVQFSSPLMPSPAAAPRRPDAFCRHLSAAHSAQPRRSLLELQAAAAASFSRVCCRTTEVSSGRTAASCSVARGAGFGANRAPWLPSWLEQNSSGLEQEAAAVQERPARVLASPPIRSGSGGFHGNGGRMGARGLVIDSRFRDCSKAPPPGEEGA